MVKIGINGFGRIGRQVFKIAQRYKDDMEIVAVNDIGTPKQMAHLLKYDSIFGTMPDDIAYDDSHISVNGVRYPLFQEKDIKRVDWDGLGAQIVVEASGKYAGRVSASSQDRLPLGGSVKKVIITAPSTIDDITLVMGVNEEAYDPATDHVISGASCTTGCLAAIFKFMDEKYGVERGMTTSVHSYTVDQKILDVSHRDLRRARAAGMSIIPTTTGAAEAIGKVLPRVAGKLSCHAVRVPTPDVSIIDIVLELKKKDITADEVNKAFEEAAAGEYKGIIATNDDELVSVDYRGNEHTAVIDTPLTLTMAGGMVKIIAWYDNEWGYSRRIVDMIRFLAEKGL
ncbi:type I glyceraldehyde-3-phosphate dehydrogenase [Anaeroglobus geminatus]|uniref:Glyceraldehyde-3-phosphate dehydrogenase n=1 Tax=Anaeroglobus geminatus F0357 TaxID=861450 RepID=G9YJI3_9FIRM|nr:type I glyceraldehyde-3-phosphate dehydrogenase [Anaeroglobus geminatus]EHM38613.1 glyceraldehyde-3-phosphate dehydrogenase, type I [Anaeroglobus geminatus F0357]